MKSSMENGTLDRQEHTPPSNDVPTNGISQDQLELRMWMEGVLAQLQAQRDSGMKPRVMPIHRRR